MANKTAAGLVSYAKAQLGKPYWYGTFGNKATQSLLTSKTKQYPTHYTSDRTAKYKSQIGQRVHDCVGLIKGYLWSESATATPKYNASQDVSANGMLSRCKEKGNISTIPEIPGVLVFMPGHVGVYIGNGRVIEARGFAYGVVETKLSARTWTSWGKCPWIIYPTATTSTVKPSANSNVSYFKKYTGKSKSIVDALKSIGVTSTFAYRKKIATANGISGYLGLSSQNIKMLNLLKQGKLVKP